MQHNTYAYTHHQTNHPTRIPILCC
uniref:Uncharacterized protein n=1 Tax=Arundo donax TaxID=35708 RepID=A0A0A9BE76_ARUDO